MIYYLIYFVLLFNYSSAKALEAKQYIGAHIGLQNSFHKFTFTSPINVVENRSQSLGNLGTLLGIHAGYDLLFPSNLILGCRIEGQLDNLKNVENSQILILKSKIKVRHKHTVQLLGKFGKLINEDSSLYGLLGAYSTNYQVTWDIDNDGFPDFKETKRSSGLTAGVGSSIKWPNTKWNIGGEFLIGSGDKFIAETNGNIAKTQPKTTQFRIVISREI